MKTGLNDSVNRVCDKVEEHEDHMTGEVMELNECLTQLSNINYTHVEVQEVGDMQSIWI